LQRNAIERLTEKGLFQQTGLATLRVKFSGFSTQNAEAGSIQRVQIDLAQSNGKDLKELVAKLINTNANRLKLICTGKVLVDGNMLDQQNVKNGSQIMVLSIATDQESFEVIFDNIVNTINYAKCLHYRKQKINFVNWRRPKELLIIWLEKMALDNSHFRLPTKVESHLTFLSTRKRRWL
jgi:hypothetical protein